MIQDKLKEFDRITAEMKLMMVHKNKDYGDDNINALGEKGIYVRMWDKMSRLRRLLWLSKKPSVKDESLIDTLFDLILYGIICLIYLRGKWK